MEMLAKGRKKGIRAGTFFLIKKKERKKKRNDHKARHGHGSLGASAHTPNWFWYCIIR